MKENWIAIIGSPRRLKNSEKLANLIIDELREKNVFVKKYNLDKKVMSPCMNCEACIKNGKCQIDDEVTEILEEIKVSEGVIFVSPSYNYNISAQMKILLDRTFSLNDYTGEKWSSRIKSDAKAIIGSVCKGSTKESMGYTTRAMEKVVEELGFKLLDSIEYYDTKNNPVGDNEELVYEIKNRINMINV